MEVKKYLLIETTGRSAETIYSGTGAIEEWLGRLGEKPYGDRYNISEFSVVRFPEGRTELRITARLMVKSGENWKRKLRNPIFGSDVAGIFRKVIGDLEADWKT